jgi:uncharacterized protein (DUF4415 family)
MTHGGKRTNAGRPKAPPKQQVTIRLTKARYAVYKSTGGQRWLNRMLDEKELVEVKIKEQ